jgi:phage recombination protein Bet
MQPQPLRELDLNKSQLSLIRRTLAADCNEDEFSLFIEVAKRMKADPFRRHVYAFVFGKNDAEKRKLSIVTGIDFYRVVAARNRDYRPGDKPANFIINEALKSSENPLGIECCEVTCYKLTADMQWYPVVGVAYWSEYVPIEETAESYEWVDTGEVWADSKKPKKRKMPVGPVTRQPKGKWLTMPRVMIAKCAEAQALRRGWPEDLSGVYVEEELDRARADEYTAAELAEQEAVEKRLKLAGASETVMVCWGPGLPLEPVPVGKFADRAMAFLQSADKASDVIAWQDTNRHPLREFWARAKADGLAVSKATEARIKELHQSAHAAQQAKETA